MKYVVLILVSIAVCTQCRSTRSLPQQNNITYTCEFLDRNGLTCAYELLYSIESPKPLTQAQADKLFSETRRIIRPSVGRLELETIITSRDSIIEAVTTELQSKSQDAHYTVKNISVNQICVSKSIYSFLKNRNSPFMDILSEMD